MLYKRILTILSCGLVATNLQAQKPEAIKEYNAGLEYYNLKNYEAAAPFFKEAVKKDPSFYNAQRVLISCYEQSNKEEDAIAAYEKCITMAPGEKALPYNLAQTYIKRKEYEKAALWLRKALEIDPTYDKATQSLKQIEDYLSKVNHHNAEHGQEEHQGGDDASTVNRIYNEALRVYKEGKYEEAIDILNAFKGEVTNVSFYYLKAITYQQLGQREKAIDAYESALELDDRHFDSNLNLGTIYYNDQRFEEAIPLLETAYERRKNDRKILYSLARAHYYNNEFREALPLLESYTAMVSDDAEAFFFLSKCYDKTGDKKKSEMAFEQAKKLGGKGTLSDELDRSVAEYGKKASELAKSGDYKKAIEVLEEAITKHSEQASLHYNLGLNYLEVGNQQKAQAEFSKAVDLDPSHAKAYQALGSVYYDKGDYSTAGAYYQATLKAGKQDEFVYYKLGSCHYFLNRFYDAIQAYEKAVEINPKEKQFFFGLALSYLKNKDNLKSIKALEQALALDASFLDAQYHICINYIEMNEFQKAIDEGAKIVQKDANYAKAYLVMAHGYKRLGKLAEADKYKQIAVRLDPSLRD